MKTLNLLSSFILIIISFSTTGTTQAQLIELAPSTTPNASQQAQIDRRYGMFIHFGINTFADQEWTDGTRSPSTYQPTAIDAEQWVAAAYTAGMKHVILTCKHHDGFCLWDSPQTTYDVAHPDSGNNTDVVKAVADACKKYGIGFGVYYSVWDRNRNSDTGNATLDAAYNQYMLDQIEDLMTNYGDVVELWLDGAWVKANNRWNVAEIYDLVKRKQPNCQVSTNWSVGSATNADQHEVTPSQQQANNLIRYHSSDFRLADPYLPKFTDPKLFTHNGQTYYLPFESTITLTGKWFFHTQDIGNHRSVDSLVKDYFIATAQDNILIYNSPPNRNGVLRATDVQLLKDIAARIGLQPGQPFAANFSKGATASASAVWQNDPTYGADKAIDENPDTRWASGPVGLASATLEVDFGANRTFDRVFIDEYLENGSGRIQNFTIEYWNGTQWNVAHTGTTVGKYFKQSFTAVTGSKARINITNATNAPSIHEFRVEFENNAYRNWREAHFPGQQDSLTSGDAADSDGDKIPNVLEYLLESDPKSKSNLPPVSVIDHAGVDWARWSIPMQNSDVLDAMQIEYSHDLITWKDVSKEPNTIATSAKTSSNWTVEVKTDPETKCFFRIKVN